MPEDSFSHGAAKIKKTEPSFEKMCLRDIYEQKMADHRVKLYGLVRDIALRLCILLYTRTAKALVRPCVSAG